MRSLLTLSILLLLALPTAAQEVKQQVISSAGGFSISDDYSVSLSWTLGELVINTIKSDDNQLILSQGFQQSELVVDGINVHPDLGVSVAVYPNPTSEIVNIRIESPQEGETSLSLSGQDGRLVWTGVLLSGEMQLPINLQDYPAGTFFLKIQNGIRSNVYKIIKL